FLLLPPPSRSILFPYTTLFRSFSDVVLDLEGVTPFNQRVYDCVRGIPRGETRSAEDIADELHVPEALHEIAQALTNNAFVLIVRSEEHTSELQSHLNLVCRLLL